MGTLMNDPNTVATVITSLMFLFGMGGGILAHIGPGTNFLIRFLSWISPFRYGTELILRCILKDV
jgi:hypothetical protein